MDDLKSDVQLWVTMAEEGDAAAAWPEGTNDAVEAFLEKRGWDVRMVEAHKVGTMLATYDGATLWTPERWAEDRDPGRGGYWVHVDECHHKRHDGYDCPPCDEVRVAVEFVQ